MEYGEGGGGGGGGGGEEEVESKAAGLLGESPMVEPEDGGWVCVYMWVCV